MCNESCIQITKAEPSRMLSNIANLKVKSGAGNPESVLTYDVCTISDLFKYNDNDCSSKIPFWGRKEFDTS